MSAPIPYAPPPMPWPPPPPPSHPAAQRALTVGIVALAGGFVLLLPIVLSPLAWYWGAASKNAIDRDPERWGGRSTAKSGMILGIIGTGLLIVGLVLLGAFVALIAFASSYTAGY